MCLSLLNTTALACSAPRARRSFSPSPLVAPAPRFSSSCSATARHVQCFHELHPLMSHDYLRLPYWETYHERMSVKAGAIAARISDAEVARRHGVL
jgi:hypothetical protein